MIRSFAMVHFSHLWFEDRICTFRFHLEMAKSPQKLRQRFLGLIKDEIEGSLFLNLMLEKGTGNAFLALISPLHFKIIIYIYIYVFYINKKHYSILKDHVYTNIEFSFFIFPIL